MKKIISMILAMLIILSCFTFSAYAKSNKLIQQLADELDAASPNQVIKVNVSLYANEKKETFLTTLKEKILELVESGEISASVLKTMYEQYPSIFDGTHLGIYDVGELAEPNDAERIKYLRVAASISRDDLSKYNEKTFNDIVERYSVNAKVINISDIGYTVLANLTKEDILKIVDDERISAIGSFEAKTSSGKQLDYFNIYTRNDEYSVYNACSASLDRFLARRIGEYIVRNKTGDSLDYYVYIYSEDRMIKLEDAFCIKNISYALNAINAERIGDMDKDGIISIFDVTLLQACLSDLQAFEDDDRIIGLDNIGEKIGYISDYNRDGDRDILDATAIQLKLAKIE